MSIETTMTMSARMRNRRPTLRILFPSLPLMNEVLSVFRNFAPEQPKR